MWDQPQEAAPVTGTVIHPMGDGVQKQHQAGMQPPMPDFSMAGVMPEMGGFDQPFAPMFDGGYNPMLAQMQGLQMMSMMGMPMPVHPMMMPDMGNLPNAHAPAFVPMPVGNPPPQQQRQPSPPAPVTRSVPEKKAPRKVVLAADVRESDGPIGPIEWKPTPHNASVKTPYEQRTPEVPQHVQLAVQQARHVQNSAPQVRFHTHPAQPDQRADELQGYRSIDLDEHALLSSLLSG